LFNTNEKRLQKQALTYSVLAKGWVQPPTPLLVVPPPSSQVQKLQRVGKCFFIFNPRFSKLRFGSCEDINPNEDG